MNISDNFITVLCVYLFTYIRKVKVLNRWQQALQIVDLQLTCVLCELFTDDGLPELDGKLRLVGGTTPNRGRLEILKNGLWGTVCSFHFDKAEADVACRQMGFHHAEKILEKLVWI